MACSKNFFDDVKKELECSVCQEQFSDLREPKILKCLHTFCKSCLTAWLPRQQREGELSCPTCRRITQCSANDINKLPSNLFCKQLVEIVEAYSGQVGHEDSPHCGVCDEKKALKFYCIECSCFLCGDCAGLHGKAKAFKGHNIKEISNFNSNDVQKYVRRANVCKKHEDELRYYCEKCNICICRDCAMLEHSEHKRISLDHGLDLKKSDIMKRIQEVEDVGRRLQEQKANLEKQRTRFDTSVDQSKLEINRVAEHRINVIRRHEEAMTRELLKLQESFENEFSAKVTDLNEKLTDVKNSLEFGRDILERNNLPEILNVEETLGRRFEDLLSSTGFSGPAELSTLSVKYVANDTSFSESELGKLVDPIMSIVRGKGAKEVHLGEDFSLTKNWRGKTTYGEVDQAVVDITSLRRTDEATKSRQSDLKDGWNVYDERVVTSVLQHNEKVDDVKLTLKPYSDEDIKAEVFEVVSSELCLDYLQSLSREEIKGLLLEVESKIGLRWVESAESFVISGTLRQVEEAHRVLMKGVYLANGIEVVSDQEIKNEEAPQPHETGLSQTNEEQREVMQRDVNQESARPPLAGAGEVSPLPDRAKDSDNDQWPRVESLAIEVLPFEVQPKILKVLAGAHKKELDDIETEYRVAVPRAVTEGNQISLKPSDGCSAEDYEKACDAFITLYQKTTELFKAERFSLSRGPRKVSVREAISRMLKEVPEVLIERSRDQKYWEMYGEAGHLQKALSYLKKIGVEVEMESKAFKDESDLAGRAKSKGAESVLDGDQSENPRGSTTSSDQLVLNYGRVKLSVYKGDITSEHADVIVSPSDNHLNHSWGVAKAIFDKGGKEVEDTSRDVIRKKHGGFLKDGEATWTKPGNLSCKYVVHVVVPIWNTLGPKKSREVLHRGCLNSLIEAEKRKATSIALPAIGSGSFGMPKDICAEVMCDTVREFVEKRITQKKTITDIRFVDNDDHSVHAFSKKLKTLFEYNSIGNHASRPVTQHPLGLDCSDDVNNRSFSASGGSSSHGTSHSNALRRNTLGNHGSLQKTLEPRAPNEGKDNKGEECPNCLNSISNPRSLKCKHTFCSDCLQHSLDISNKCPVCQEPQGVLKGNQPPGEMRSRVVSYSVPGYEGYGTIIIDYSFLSGIQGVQHPNPGQRYEGTFRQAYLPNTREGREVLQLLRRAFDARLVFTVGTSTTTGRQNQTTWSDIHHKTSKYGGPFQYGYPDPDYLRRVKEELAAKGIK